MAENQSWFSAFLASLSFARVRFWTARSTDAHCALAPVISEDAWVPLESASYNSSGYGHPYASAGNIVLISVSNQMMCRAR